MNLILFLWNNRQFYDQIKLHALTVILQELILFKILFNI